MRSIAEEKASMSLSNGSFFCSGSNDSGIILNFKLEYDGLNARTPMYEFDSCKPDY
jgi:hypothetical protein